MSVNRLIEVEFRPQNSQAIILNGLKIGFDVLKTSDPKANETTLNIWNLSKTTYDRTAIVDTDVIIRAGYEDEGGLIAIAYGKVISSKRKIERPEIIHEYTILDGQKESRDAYVSVSYKRGTTSSTIIRNLIEFIGLPIALGSDIPQQEYTSGYSFVGLAVDALGEVLARLSYTFTIQNQEIYIFKEGDFINAQAEVISPETGMIDSPVALTDAQDSGNAPSDKQKYSVRSLLKPRILPNTQISIQSSVASGFFIAQTVHHVGDNWEGDFTTDMEVISV